MEIPIVSKELIVQIDPETGKPINSFPDVKTAASVSGTNITSIYKIVNKKGHYRNMAGGYHWRKLKILLQARLPEDDQL